MPRQAPQALSMQLPVEVQRAKTTGKWLRKSRSKISRFDDQKQSLGYHGWSLQRCKSRLIRYKEMKKKINARELNKPKRATVANTWNRIKLKAWIALIPLRKTSQYAGVSCPSMVNVGGERIKQWGRQQCLRTHLEMMNNKTKPTILDQST